MRNRGWRRANKTLYLEQPRLRVGDDFNNEACRRGFGNTVLTEDSACAGCGYLVCGCERLKAREPEAVTVDERDRQPEPVRFQVGDVVRLKRGSDCGERVGTIEAQDSEIKHFYQVRLDTGLYLYGELALELVGRAGEPEAVTVDERDRQPEPVRFQVGDVVRVTGYGNDERVMVNSGLHIGSTHTVTSVRAQWVRFDGSRCGWNRDSFELVRRAGEPERLIGNIHNLAPSGQQMSALPPLPEGFEFAVDPEDDGLVANGEEKRAAQCADGRWVAQKWAHDGNNEDWGWYDCETPARTTVYDALADALGLSKVDVMRVLENRGWTFRGSWVYRNVWFRGSWVDRNGWFGERAFDSMTPGGRWLEHEARVLAAEREASRG